MSERFLKAIREKSIQSISIVGLGKNVGKTVTLNYLVNFLSHLNLGLTSIGLDGEKIDQLTNTKKPSILVPKGSLMATATKTLRESTAKYEILAGTGIINPLGEVMIVRVLEHGNVILAGPERSNDLKKVIEILTKYHCQKILVDGAIDRRMSASPYLTSGCILATGASYSRDINKLIRDTIHQIKILTLPKADEIILTKIDEQKDKTNILLICENRIYELPFTSLLNAKNIDRFFVKDYLNNLIIKGALLDEFIYQITPLVKQGYRINIVVKDGTKVFVKPELLMSFERAGGEVKVMENCNLLGVTVNPVAVEGYGFDSGKIISILKDYTDSPIIDPLS